MDALSLVEAIPGWLRPEDAAELYELALATPGPILEIGTHRGKSAILMALAAQKAGRGALIYSLDVDRSAIRAAAAEARARGLDGAIVFLRGTLTAFTRAYPQVRPMLTFIDGDHSRRGVERDLSTLENIVPAGGLMLFHDFADPLNDDPSCDQVNVRPAVQSSWVTRQCEFIGTFGVCGLFERREAPATELGRFADLLRLASVRDQYLHRLRYPAGKTWRRVRARR